MHLYHYIHKCLCLYSITSWQNLKIHSFDPDAIKVDNEMLSELDRLQQKFNSMYMSM